jgi:hypothetical protein
MDSCIPKEEEEEERQLNIMDCIRQNHTYKLEQTMFVIAIQEQHVIIAVLHFEVAMRPEPFN